MSKKIIVGNWKMDPITLDEAKRVFRSVKNASKKLLFTEVIVCPPEPFLGFLLKNNKDLLISIGAQNAYFEEQGHFTGEVSPYILKDIGVSHVILGHSERRAMGETDEIVSKKVQMALEAGLKVILCVGEKDRDANGEYLNVLKSQIKNSLDKVQKKNINRLLIAYEPVWAIGAKDPMNPATVYEMSIFVKKVLSDIYGQDEVLSIPILYGGAVNFRNAGDILVQGKVNGLLVGRESINSSGFVELLKTIDLLK